MHAADSAGIGFVQFRLIPRIYWIFFLKFTGQQCVLPFHTLGDVHRGIWWHIHRLVAQWRFCLRDNPRWQLAVLWFIHREREREMIDLPCYYWNTCNKYFCNLSFVGWYCHCFSKSNCLDTGIHVFQRSLWWLAFLFSVVVVVAVVVVERVAALSRREQQENHGNRRQVMGMTGRDWERFGKRIKRDFRGVCLNVITFGCWKVMWGNRMGQP